MDRPGAQADGATTRILVHLPEQAPWSFEVQGARTLVGRGPHCDIRLDHETISWDHLELTRHGDAVVALDLGSRNGTLLNGRPLTAPARLHGGDVLKLGWGRLTVQAQQADAGRRATAVATARPIVLTEAQRELARALVAPFRNQVAAPARPPTRAELAATLHLSERTVQRRLDELVHVLGLPPHAGHERALLLAQRIIEAGLDVQR